MRLTINPEESGDAFALLAGAGIAVNYGRRGAGGDELYLPSRDRESLRLLRDRGIEFRQS